MKKILFLGQFLYALAVAGFGIIQLFTQNFLSTLLPFPSSIPLYLVWMYTSAIIMVAAAAAIFANIQRGTAGAVLGIMFFIFFLILHVPSLLGKMQDPLEWTVAFETLLIGSGGFIIAAEFIQKTHATRLKRVVIFFAAIGRYLIACSLIVFAVLHIIYTSFIQKMIPAWMPAHLILAVIVISGLLLAALSFILDIKVRLSSTLLGVMFLIWVLLVHIPAVINNTHAVTEWISLCIALACSGTAFSLAARNSGNLSVYRAF